MSWVIYNRELHSYLITSPDNHTYMKGIGKNTRKFKTKKEAQEFIKRIPSHSFVNSSWYNKETRIVVRG